MKKVEPCNLPEIFNLGICRGVCPCDCVHCPVGLKPQGERKSYFGHSEMSTEVFQKFCEEIKNQNVTVRLHGVGEPTLHSDFQGLLQIINQTGLKDKFWLFTAALFERELIAPLVSSLNIIEVSVNSTNAEDYLTTKGVDAFARVKENIYLMKEEIKKRKLSTRIVLTRVQNNTENDKEFVHYWKKEGFECFVRSYHSYSGILDSDSMEAGKSIPTPKCLVPWKRFNLDGTIEKEALTAVNCFNILFQHPDNINPKAILGRYPENSLHEIWNNSPFNQLREQFDSGQHTGTPCDDCTECLTSEGPRSEHLLNPTETSC